MYNDLLKIYHSTNVTMFVCAVTYIFDKGMQYVKEISDDEIEAIEGNALMTKDFCQDIVKTAREICQNIENGVELVQFCNAESVFETERYTNGEHIDRHRLESITRQMANALLYDDVSLRTQDQLAEYLELEPEDIDSILAY